MAASQKPEPGDLIEIFRGFYQHWAVYVGNNDVTHVTVASDDPGASANSFISVPNEKAMVKQEKLTDVVKNDEWKISNKLDNKYQPYPKDTILKGANANVGKTMEYSLLRKNCEHFANELRYGQPESRQVEEGVSKGVLYGAGAAFLAIVAGGMWHNKNKATRTQ